VIQYRRLSALLLGAWLGASIFADIAVTQNFQTVDRFLETPGTAATSMELNKAGRAEERKILRRNAGEENNWIFLNWERIEIALGAVLFMLLLFGERPQKLLLALCLAMIAIVAAEHFLLTERIADLGRRIDELAPNDPQSAQFWKLHGFYSGLDILKLTVGMLFAARLATKRKLAADYFARDFDASMTSQGRSKRG
jgi:hypothetical protein